MNNYKIHVTPRRGGWEPEKWLVAVKQIDHDAEIVEVESNVWEVHSSMNLEPAFTKYNGVIGYRVIRQNRS